MKKIMLPLAAVAALAAAAPAYADHDRGQRYHQSNYSGASNWLRSVDARAARLERAALIARDQHQISPQLANSIVGSVRGAARTARTYARRGLNQEHVRATEQRFRDQELRLRSGDYHAAEYGQRRGYYAPRW